jgi:hypothetical protein
MTKGISNFRGLAIIERRSIPQLPQRMALRQ